MSKDKTITMTRDELIKQIGLTYLGTYPSVFRDILTAALKDFASQLPDIKGDGWKDVKYELPELMTSEDGRYRASEWVNILRNGKPVLEFGLWDGKNWYSTEGSQTIHDVTHWFEVPELPQKPSR